MRNTFGIEWSSVNPSGIPDGFAEAKFKPVSGKEDQAGGLVFRFTDANNYYVVRANALEGNVVLYKTVNGKRSSLQSKGRMFGYGVDIKVPNGKWSNLRVAFAGKLFTVFSNGKKLVEVGGRNIQGAGRSWRLDKGRQHDALRRFRLRSKINQAQNIYETNHSFQINHLLGNIVGGVISLRKRGSRYQSD